MISGGISIRSRLASVLKHVPSGQMSRYLVVGLWNTAFGYGTYAGFTALLSPYGGNSYLAAMLLSTLTNITVAFFGYKWFVFKTRGNYLKEWLRCLSVYSGNVLLSFIALPGLVYLLRHEFGYGRGAPYIGGAILTMAGVILSFFGHKHVSFRQTAKEPICSPQGGSDERTNNSRE